MLYVGAVSTRVGCADAIVVVLVTKGLRTIEPQTQLRIWEMGYALGVPITSEVFFWVQTVFGGMI